MERKRSRERAILLIAFIAILGFLFGVAIALLSQDAPAISYYPLAAIVGPIIGIIVAFYHRRKEK